MGVIKLTSSKIKTIDYKLDFEIGDKVIVVDIGEISKKFEVRDKYIGIEGTLTEYTYTYEGGWVGVTLRANPNTVPSGVNTHFGGEIALAQARLEHLHENKVDYSKLNSLSGR